MKEKWIVNLKKKIFHNFSTELSFAYEFENMLNCYEDPVYKQMAVEFFSVVSKIINRHPEINFTESLNVDKMIEKAANLYSNDYNADLEVKISPDECKEKFLRDSVSITSSYMGKAIIIHLLDGKSLTQFGISSATSDFQCHVQW